MKKIDTESGKREKYKRPLWAWVLTVLLVLAIILFLVYGIIALLDDSTYKERLPEQETTEEKVIR